jgi:vacuolar-type H+-ATPase subunit C/Vma6
MRADIINFGILLKGRVRKIPKEEIKKHFIENGSRMHGIIDELIGAETIEKLAEKCSLLEYYPALSKALEEYKKDKSLSHFERELERFYIREITKKELYNSQGPYQIFSYLAKKENEFRNLLIASQGIDKRLSPEEIEEMIL